MKNSGNRREFLIRRRGALRGWRRSSPFTLFFSDAPGALPRRCGAPAG